MDEVAPAGPSDAASGLKEAVSGAKDALPDSAADVVPDKATEAVDRAAKSNPFSGLFGGGLLSLGRIATGVSRTLLSHCLSLCACAAGAKDTVDEAAPASASDAVQGVKEAVGGAKDAAQDAAPKAADSNPFSGFFGGEHSPLSIAQAGDMRSPGRLAEPAG